MKEEKLLSVVIPVFNVEKYLSKTLDCIIEQTYTNWELILVDDGSTDESFEIAKKYSLKDERIKAIHRDTLPKGAPHCRNIGLERSTGFYVIFLDSDDIIAPYCLQQRVEYIEREECDFAVFPIVGFYNKLFDARLMLLGYKIIGDETRQLLRRTLPFVVCTNIYKRSVLVEKGVKWDEHLKSYQDSDFNLTALRTGMIYKVSNSLPDYFYRLSAQGSICKKLNTRQSCESQFYFLKKQYEIYGKNKEYRKDLLICSVQIFRNVIYSDDVISLSTQFTGLNMFKMYPLLRVKLRCVARLCTMLKNDRLQNAFLALLCPVYFFRFWLILRDFGKNKVDRYKELEKIFYSSVDSKTITFINERV